MTLLTLLLGTLLAAGASTVLSGTSSEPAEDAPFELACHGHGWLGPDGEPGGPGGPGWGRRGRGGPGPGPAFGGPGRGPCAERGPGFGGGPAGAHLRILDSMPGDLALTDAQWDRILEIMGDAQTAMDPLMEQRRERHDALRELMHAEPLNEEAIRTGVTDMAQLQADMAVAMARTRAKVTALLTPEQKRYLETERDRMQERRQRHRQFRDQMRGGWGPAEG